MSNYNITTNFGDKDSLPSGNAQKVVKGSEFTTEFTNIKTAVNSKADIAGATFTGTVNINADVAVDNSVFVVNTTANRVGVNNATPSATLDLTGTLNATGNTTIGGTLGVTGATTLSNTLAVTGNSTVGGTLGVTGNTTVGGTLGVTGNTTLTDATVSGTLGVTGITTLGDDLILDTDAVSLLNTSTVGGKGRIGVGTATPSYHLEVAQSTDAYIGFKTPSTKTNSIFFHDSTSSTTSGTIEYSHVTDALTFKVNAQGANALTLGNDNTVYVNNRLSINEGNPTAIEGKLHINASNTTSALSIDNTNSGGVGNQVTLLNYQRNGTTVSRLTATDDGSISYIRGTTTGDSGFGYQGTSLSPMSQSAVSNFGTDNGGSDLGTTSSRWGTVYLVGSPNVSSDQRLKENITDADDAGSTIDAIQIRKFDWIDSGEHQSYGVVAQELAEVFPEAVSGDEDEEYIMGVTYEKLIPMLVKEVQSLRSRVAELENN